MPDELSLPFERFSFTIIEDRKPRGFMRMEHEGQGMYELHVEKGSAANPTMQFTRTVPLESAQRLKDALQAIGVFDWAESYGNAAGRPACRWSVSTVFKEGVFSLASKGGSEVPAGFGDMLEELYRLDFPRPNAGGSANAAAGAAGAAGLGTSGMLNSLGSVFGSSGLPGMGSLNIGDMGAYGAAGGLDFSKMADALGQAGLSGFDAAELGNLLSEAGRNPQALQQRMRDEFRHMTPDEQNRMLDALASTGMASRAWWERFLKGL